MDELGKETPFEGCEECAALSEECAALGKRMGKEIAGGERSDFTNCYDNSEETGRRRQQEKKELQKWVVLVVIVAMIVCYNVPATRYQLAWTFCKMWF